MSNDKKATDEQGITSDLAETYTNVVTPASNMIDLHRLLNYFFWLIFAALCFLLLSWLQPVLAPFIIAAASAYLGDPIVDRLERWNLSRTLAVSIVFVVMTLLVTSIVLLLLPLILNQIDLFRQDLPRYVSWFESTVMPFVNNFLGADKTTDLIASLNQVMSDNWEKIGDLVPVVVARATQSGLLVIGWLASALLIPVVTFYLLRDWDILIQHIADLLPRNKLPVVSQLAKECDEVLGQFLRGQLLIMLSLSVLYVFGLSLMGLKLGVLVGLVAGLASVVPYLGAAVGILAASIAAFVQFHDLFHVIIVLVIFGAGQLLESLFLTPVLVGDKIGLHPVAVIFAVLAGGTLFGFTGVLLALPVAAVAMVLLRHAHHNYRSSVFYHSSP